MAPSCARRVGISWVGALFVQVDVVRRVRRHTVCLRWDGLGPLSRERVRACATGRNTEGSQVWGRTQRVSQSQMLSCLSQPHEKGKARSVGLVKLAPVAGEVEALIRDRRQALKGVVVVVPQLQLCWLGVGRPSMFILRRRDSS